MKANKMFLVSLSLLQIISLFFITIQYNTINNLENISSDLTKQNKGIEKLNKELKKTIDIKDENIVSLKHELDAELGFNSFVHFNPSNITELSGVNYEQLAYGLKGTKLHEYIDSFLTVERKYKINAFVMIGIVANESAWLSSNRALSQNNVTGYAVYSDSSKGTTFSSVDECIIKTAELLTVDYIDKNGRFHTGLSVTDINTLYSSDEKWDDTVTQIANQTKDRINEMVKIFHSR